MITRRAITVFLPTRVEEHDWPKRGWPPGEQLVHLQALYTSRTTIATPMEADVQAELLHESVNKTTVYLLPDTLSEFTASYAEADIFEKVTGFPYVPPS